MKNNVDNYAGKDKFASFFFFFLFKLVILFFLRDDIDNCGDFREALLQLGAVSGRIMRSELERAHYLVQPYPVDEETEAQINKLCAQCHPANSRFQPELTLDS